MPPKPYRLINYEKAYARTGEVPQESSYRNHELRNRVQTKANQIDDRVDALWEDTISVSLLKNVNINTIRRPYALGNTFGEIALNLFAERESASRIELCSEFLAGVIEGIDYESPHDQVTAPKEKEYRSELLEYTQTKTNDQLEEEAEGAQDFFEEIQIRDQKIREIQNHIQRMLEDNQRMVGDSNHFSPKWIVNQIRYELVDRPRGYQAQYSNWNPVRSLSEEEILEVVEEERLVERQLLRTQIGDDIERLYRDWKNQNPNEIFRYIASQKDRQTIHTSEVVRKFGNRSITTAILNDLAGVTGRRKDEYDDRVFDDSPLLHKTGDNWEVTVYGEVMADWLSEGLGLTNTSFEEELEAVYELGLFD